MMQYRLLSSRHSFVYVTTDSITSSGACSKYGDSASLSDCLVPGAISNRTLEHLTESTVRPQQYRAIRGEHHPAMSYATSQCVHFKLLFLILDSRTSVLCSAVYRKNSNIIRTFV